MTKLTQGELLNYAFKEALHREEERLARYNRLSETIRDERIGNLFQKLASSSNERINVIKTEIKNYNIKILY